MIYTRYFLDLDNTVTASRQKISPEMRATLKRINGRYCNRIIIVSGAGEEQIKYQLDGFPAIILSQNGNVNDLWQRYLTDEEREKIYSHIRLYADPDVEDMTENRGAQISYSFTGHHADVAYKKLYDPDGYKRRKILETFPVPEGIEAKIGGTTCIDYFPAGLNKGYNIFKYIVQKQWKIRNCVYVGDALFPGGNDESVIGVIPTFPVKGHLDTLRFLTV